MNQPNNKCNKDTGGIGLFLMITGVVLMSLKAFVPAATPRMPGGILLAVILLILGGVMLCVGTDKFVKYLMSSLALFLIPILSLLQSLIVNDGKAFSYLVTVLMLIVWPVFSSYVLAHRHERRIKYLSRALLLYFSALLVLTMVTTYLGNLEFPGASRALAHSETDTSGLLPLYFEMNIGGFAFVYTITLCLPLLAYWMKTCKISMMLGAAGFVVAILSIISSQYSIALMMSIISVSMCFFPRQIRVSHILSFVALFLVFLLTGPLIGDFFLYLSKNIEGLTMSARMEEVYQIFRGGGMNSTSDTATRVGLIAMSWNTFYANSFFGSSVGAGGHSYLVDTLAHFGIVGLVAIVVSFRYMYKKYVITLKHTDLYYYVLACYLINIVQCYVNTYNGFVLFTLILPMFVVAFQDKIKQTTN